jgi:CBS domain-containing protein
MKKIADVMNRDVYTINPTSTVKNAADLMRALEVSVLPVCEDKKILGVLTDREMTIHVVAVGRDPGTTLVNKIMVPAPAVLPESSSLKAAERLMQKQGSHWVFATDADGNLSGLVSLGKVARADNEKAAGAVVRKISRGHRRVG